MICSACNDFSDFKITAHGSRVGCPKQKLYELHGISLQNEKQDTKGGYLDFSLLLLCSSVIFEGLKLPGISASYMPNGVTSIFSSIVYFSCPEMPILPFVVPLWTALISLNIISNFKTDRKLFGT